MVSLSYVNIFAQDVEALSDFYTALFGLAEVEAQRSPIFRAVRAGAVVLGFNAPAAYALLALEDRVHARGVKLFLTFDAAGPDDVAALTGRVAGLGGRVVKPPYDTSYGTRQSVACDPEGNVFRINAPGLTFGVET